MEKRNNGKIDRNEVVFGVHPVLEALNSGKEIEKVLLQRDVKNEKTGLILEEISSRDIPYQKVPYEKLQRITRKNHQGVIAFLSPLRYASLDNIISTTYEKGEVPLIVILDRITDVRNLGAIARTCECMGVHALVVPSRGSAMINSDAVKTSAGALHTLPVCRELNLKNTINYLQESGVRVTACTEKAEKPYYMEDLKGPAAIIMGSEENGVSAEYRKIADSEFLIPMQGRISSLNVSVATGIILSDVSRQRATGQE